MGAITDNERIAKALLGEAMPPLCTQVVLTLRPFEVPKVVVTQLLDGQAVDRVLELKLQAEPEAPAGPACEGPIAYQPIDEAGPRWICGVSFPAAAPGSGRCDSAPLRACGSEAPQCPRRA